MTTSHFVVQAENSALHGLQEGRVQQVRSGVPRDREGGHGLALQDLLRVQVTQNSGNNRAKPNIIWKRLS